MRVLETFLDIKVIGEVLILWFIIYHILLFLVNSRARQVLIGVLLLTAAFIVFERLKLDELSWLLSKLLGISVLGLLVIFQPEIRQGLGRLGQRHIFGAPIKEGELERALKELGRAIEALSKDKLGAIIAIERTDSLSPYLESGVLIDARITGELIQAIFTPNNPLHDGGMIIQQDKISAAACLFPLSGNESLSRVFGTRHRAGLGLCEETDAIVIIVSEERGELVLVYRAKLYRDLNKDEMLSRVKEILQENG